MIRIRKSTLEISIAIFIGLFPVVLLLWVFDRQVPESVSDDISARIYPDTLAYAWLVLSAAQLVEAVARRGQGMASISWRSLGFQAGLLAIVIVGFVILSTIGYLVGAAFYILAFTWMLKERGWLARGLAVATPVAVYATLNLAFGVRLPSLLDQWWF